VPLPRVVVLGHERGQVLPRLELVAAPVVPKATKISSQAETSCGTPGFAPIASTVVFGSVATAPRFVPGSA
jgi:hypothetical protein